MRNKNYVFFMFVFLIVFLFFSGYRAIDNCHNGIIVNYECNNKFIGETSLFSEISFDDCYRDGMYYTIISFYAMVCLVIYQTTKDKRKK